MALAASTRRPITYGLRSVEELSRVIEDDGVRYMFVERATKLLRDAGPTWLQSGHRTVEMRAQTLTDGSQHRAGLVRN